MGSQFTAAASPFSFGRMWHRSDVLSGVLRKRSREHAVNSLVRHLWRRSAAITRFGHLTARIPPSFSLVAALPLHFLWCATIGSRHKWLGRLSACAPFSLSCVPCRKAHESTCHDLVLKSRHSHHGQQSSKCTIIFQPKSIFRVQQFCQVWQKYSKFLYYTNESFENKKR